MSEPREIELWPCRYSAGCSEPGCRRPATTILRYLDNRGRPDHQTDACDTHTSELCAELRVIDRRRRPEIVAPAPARSVALPQLPIGIQPDVGRFRERKNLLAQAWFLAH
jgi:hypothetical protein